MTVVDPPGEYYGRNYYAVYFTDPDGMKLEGMIWAPPRDEAQAGGAKENRRRSENPESGAGALRTPRAASTGVCATTVLRPRRLAA